jgi:hypothetical protein
MVDGKMEIKMFTRAAQEKRNFLSSSEEGLAVREALFGYVHPVADGGVEVSKTLMETNVTSLTTDMNKAPAEYSARCRASLWVAIFAAFLVVHTPRDKVVSLSESAVSFVFNTIGTAKTVFGSESAANRILQHVAVKLKYIVFLISLIILCRPIAGSLKRAEFLWDAGKLTRRLILSGTVFLCLTILVFPSRLTSMGYRLAMMSVAPFEAASGWHYRRLLMPAIAHFLGFDGQVLYYIYSATLNFSLIFCVVAYFEHEGIRINFLNLLSIASSGFIFFNFMAVGFADPLMFILFLLLLFAVDSHESRLAAVALSLTAHEGSVFILVPLILFLFPRRQMFKYLAVIALYFGLFMASYSLDATAAVKSQLVVDNRTGIDWVISYPWREIGGWFLSYKLLWVVIAFAVYKMIRARDLKSCATVVSICIVAPMLITVLAVDVYRLVAEGFCGLLISYTYLVRSGYGTRLIDKEVMAMNLVVPSLYVGTNNGFRFPPGLYSWLCKVVGLQSWLAKL